MSTELVKQNSQVATLTDAIKKMIPQFKLALPAHLPPERLARIALTELRKNPALSRCTVPSVLGSLMQAATLGLEPGVLGQAYLIPYRNECQLVPGWQGIVDLVSRAGRAAVWTGAVYEGDLFEYQLGSEPFVRHQPQGEDAPDKLTHVYAVGSINGVQGRIVEVWPVKKITRHRDRFNKVGQRHYSYEHFEMYGRKVALLQVLKYIPKSIELVKVIQIEHGLSTGEPVDLDIPIDTVITNADLVVDAETAVGGADYGGQDATATSALGI